MNVFFTADTHFYHSNLLNTRRKGPLKDVEEMNTRIIDNWNESIKRGDIIYHLGDFAYFRRGDDTADKKLNYLFRMLNGRIHLVPGNHDHMVLKPGFTCDIECPLKTIKYDGNIIVLCHYAMRSWDRSHHSSWHLHGHSHGYLPPWGRSFDVGVDTNNYSPYSYEEVKIKMKELEPEKIGGIL